MDLKKLLKKAGPTVRLDLCPSFTLVIVNDDEDAPKLDIRLISVGENHEWYFTDEDVRYDFARAFDAAVDDLPLVDDMTVADINKFKTRISQMLIQEVKDGNLFRSRPGLGEEDDDEEDDDGDDGEEHA